jgi:lipoteichoic acid synthase
MNETKPRAGECQTAPAQPEQRRCWRWIAPLYFCICIPLLELVLRLADRDTVFLALGLPRALLAGAALGAAIWLITTLIPPKWLARTLGGAALLFIGVLFFTQRCCRAFFGNYYQLGYLTDMSGQVAGEFLDTALQIIRQNAWFFPVALAPAVLFFIFCRKLVPARTGEKRGKLLLAQVGLVVLLQLAAVLLCGIGADERYYTVDFSANSAIPRFGLVNELRLEAKYALLGTPLESATASDALTDLAPDASLPDSSADADASQPTQSDEPTSEETQQPEEIQEPEEIVYGDNVLDIDFDTLLSEDSGSLLALDQYFSSQNPTQQNEYTGLFAGKNLIVLTAEGFSSAVIDPERTPTLYRLANEGFVFTNYYQPNWTQSTTGGEFAAMTGLIPTWVGSKTSFTASIGDAMPFALGWQFSQLGYTVTAYHNNTYTYYGRDKTHPNLGYNYYGVGNGLELEHPSQWPCSDLEMMQSTVEEQIQSYLDTGTPFHTYYMTVSGHCNYGFQVNDMSKKNQDVVADLEGSEQVLAYLACQQELEYALEYLVDALEEAGIAEDTVIVLTADHYPYAMSEGTVDYYNELTGNSDSEKETSRYRNTLILWSGAIDEPIQVDTPCSAIDIIPTVSNLFGLSYDSRLLSGRDILAPDVEAGTVDSAMHLVVFADVGYGVSWISAAGTYEAYTNTFTPNPGVEVADDYVSQVSRLAQDRFTYARAVIEQDYYRHLFPDF